LQGDDGLFFGHGILQFFLVVSLWQPHRKRSPGKARRRLSQRP
jgi:hypothetical protein